MEQEILLIFENKESKVAKIKDLPIILQSGNVYFFDYSEPNSIVGVNHIIIAKYSHFENGEFFCFSSIRFWNNQTPYFDDVPVIRVKKSSYTTERLKSVRKATKKEMIMLRAMLLEEAFEDKSLDYHFWKLDNQQEHYEKTKQSFQKRCNEIEINDNEKTK